MFRTFISAYPWDLIDADLSATLDRFQGELGISGVSVQMSGPAMTCVRMRDILPRIHRTRGGLFFDPHDEKYEITRCKPIASAWARSKDPLSKIAVACEERGLDLRLVVSASRTGRIAHRQPEMACKNVFGDSSEESLCLSNPDVQTFLCGLLEDLSSRHRLDGITLVDFHTVWSEALNPLQGLERLVDRPERYLLGLCFCESCLQRADEAALDVSATRDVTQKLLDKQFSGGQIEERTVESILEGHASLADYQQWRGRELSGLLKRLSGHCECSLRVVKPAFRVLHVAQGGLGHDEVAAILALQATDSLDAVVDQAKDGQWMRIPADLALGSHAQHLVSAFSKAAQQGVEMIEIADFGLLPDTGLETIRQAIRFARRNATA